MMEDWDDDKDFDDADDELEGELYFDCHMDRHGQCGKAGSEECDFECPVMWDIHRREILKRQKAKA